jgi:hypothetical protein
MDEPDMKNKHSIWMAIILGSVGSSLAIPSDAQQKKLEVLSLEELLDGPGVSVSQVADRSTRFQGAQAVPSMAEYLSARKGLVKLQPDAESILTNANQEQRC